MVANRVLVITAVCVVVLFSPVLANEPKPMKPPVPVPWLVPKCATVIPLEVLEPGEAAAALTKGCAAKGATFVPLPDEKALLVYADAKTTKEIKDVLRLLGEPFTAPKKPHVIPVSDLIEVDEAAKTVKKLFPAKAVIVALRDEHALLAYVTNAEAAEIREMIRPFVERERPKSAVPPMTAPELPGAVQPVIPPRNP